MSLSEPEKVVGPSLLEAAKEENEEKVGKLLAEHTHYVNYQTRSGLTPLLIASCFGHKNVVQLLLEKGAEVDMVGTDDMTALSAASESGHHETVQILGKAGANVDHVSTRHDYTPLMFASRHGHTDTVKVLLELKANINLTTSYYNDLTALMLACKAGHTEVVKLLLPHVSNINTGRNGITPLIYASANGHADIVQLLLDKDKSQVNQRCLNGYTPLMIAGYYGHHDVARILINHGADIDIRAGDGITALIEACSHGHILFVRVLLDYDAEVNLSLYEKQRTALMIACEKNYVEIVRLLLRLDNDEQVLEVEMIGEESLSDNNPVPMTDAVATSDMSAVAQKRSPRADINRKDLDGCTALIFACEEGSMDIVQMLLDCDADVHVKSKLCSTRSPLQCAIKRNHTGIVRILLEKGANPNPSTANPSESDDDIPPLIIATLCENVDIIQLLLDKKVNVNITYKNVTPLALAIITGCHKLIEVFLEHGADVDTAIKIENDTSRLSITDLADMCADKKIIQLLECVPQKQATSTVIPSEFLETNHIPQGPIPKKIKLDADDEKYSLFKKFQEKCQSLCQQHTSRSTQHKVYDLYLIYEHPTSNPSLLERLCGINFTSTRAMPLNKVAKKPTLKQAFQVLLPLAADWYNIGVLLGLKDGDLSSIAPSSTTGSTQCRNALREMIQKWLKTVNPLPSWVMLQEAVQPFDQSIAEEIQEEFCTV